MTALDRLAREIASLKRQLLELQLSPQLGNSSFATAPSDEAAHVTLPDLADNITNVEVLADAGITALREYIDGVDLRLVGVLTQLRIELEELEGEGGSLEALASELTELNNRLDEIGFDDLAGTIDASQIVAKDILAKFVGTDRLTANHLAADLITTELIKAGGILAQLVGAAKITAEHIAAGALNAMEITGAIIKTAASGARVVIADGGVSGFINFYTGVEAAGEYPGYLISGATATDKTLQLMGPRSGTSGDRRAFVGFFGTRGDSPKIAHLVLGADRVSIESNDIRLLNAEGSTTNKPTEQWSPATKGYVDGRIIQTDYPITATSVEAFGYISVNVGQGPAGLIGAVVIGAATTLAVCNQGSSSSNIGLRNVFNAAYTIPSGSVLRVTRIAV